MKVLHSQARFHFRQRTYRVGRRLGKRSGVILNHHQKHQKSARASATAAAPRIIDINPSRIFDSSSLDFYLKRPPVSPGNNPALLFVCREPSRLRVLESLRDYRRSV